MPVSVSDAKTYFDIGKEASTGILILVGACGSGGWLAVRNTIVDRMLARWKEIAELVDECEKPGCDMQIYFSSFVERCREQLDRIQEEAELLQAQWDSKNAYARFFTPYTKCIRQAKRRLQELEDLKRELNKSSLQAANLSREGIVPPNEDQILIPSHGSWSAAGSTDPEVQVLTTAEYRAQTRLQVEVEPPSRVEQFTIGQPTYPPAPAPHRQHTLPNPRQYVLSHPNQPYHAYFAAAEEE